jgi:cysteine synthase A
VTGVGRVLKARRPTVRVVGVEPEGAAVLSGGQATGHHLQGIGAGFVPKVLDRAVLDEVQTVHEADAVGALRRLARADGVLAGLSSGAALAVALRMAEAGGLAGKRVVVVLPDGGERYVSTALFRAVAD